MEGQFFSSRVYVGGTTHLLPKLSDCLDSRAVRGDLTTEDENRAAAGSVGQCKWSEVWIAGQVSGRSDGL